MRMVSEALSRQMHVELGNVELSKTSGGHLYTVHIQSLRNEILDHCGVRIMNCKLVRALVVRKVSLDIGSDLRSVDSVPSNRNPTL